MTMDSLTLQARRTSMTSKRLKEAIEAWNKIQNTCAASNNIEWILNYSPNASDFYCFDSNHTEWGDTFWLNVDDIICAEVYRKHGDITWRVSPYIEIVDPVTDDWNGVAYNVNQI